MCQKGTCMLAPAWHLVLFQKVKAAPRAMRAGPPQGTYNGASAGATAPSAFFYSTKTIRIPPSLSTSSPSLTSTSRMSSSADIPAAGAAVDGRLRRRAPTAAPGPSSPPQPTNDDDRNDHHDRNPTLTATTPGHEATSTAPKASNKTYGRTPDGTGSTYMRCTNQRQ